MLRFYHPTLLSYLPSELIHELDQYLEYNQANDSIAVTPSLIRDYDYLVFKLTLRSPFGSMTIPFIVDVYDLSCMLENESDNTIDNVTMNSRLTLRRKDGVIELISHPPRYEHIEPYVHYRFDHRVQAAVLCAKLQAIVRQYKSIIST